jgi:hypothetical protein
MRVPNQETVMEKFVRVKVAKGKKFRGEAYDVGCEVYTSTFNIYGTGRNGWRSCESLKLWCPGKGWVYANPSYIEPVDCDISTMEADKAAYVAFIVDGTVEWCRGRSKGKTEREVLKFAHNVLSKHHPDMLLAFEEKYDYKDDVVESITGTIDWAFKLGYSNPKSVRIAHRALEKKGLTTHPAFTAAWTIALDLRGLSKLADKYTDFNREG